MIEQQSDNVPSDAQLSQLKQRARVLLLLDAAERSGIAPLCSSRLHAFAYLANVLSPVWDLVPFDGKIYKSEGGPHYPDLQSELDRLVVLGLVEIGNLHYVDRGNDGARIDGEYGLNFSSKHLEPILAALGAGDACAAIDSNDSNLHAFLVELACALATLPDEQLEAAVGVDVTYRSGATLNNVIDFGEWTDTNLSVLTAQRFQNFLPQDSSLRPGEKLFLYATYLGKVMDAA